MNFHLPVVQTRSTHENTNSHKRQQPLYLHCVHFLYKNLQVFSIQLSKRNQPETRAPPEFFTIAGYITGLTPLGFAKLVFQTYLKLFLHHQKWVKWKLMGIVLGLFPLRYDTGKTCICIGYSGKHKTKASTWQIKSASAFKQPAVRLFTTSGCVSKFSMYLSPLFHKKSSMLGLGNWYIFLCFLLSEAQLISNRGQTPSPGLASATHQANSLFCDSTWAYGHPPQVSIFPRFWAW